MTDDITLCDKSPADAGLFLFFADIILLAK